LTPRLPVLTAPQLSAHSTMVPRSAC
jgi:hypothetical protein